jgi:4'-phosphopantetheinyl transferase
LFGREIRVFGLALNASSGECNEWWQLLSSDERARASKFVRDVDRDAFVVAHAVLRLLLARYCSIPAQSLRFTRGASGKPALDIEGGASSVRFNLAHSGGNAVVAITRDADVGVDLEAVRQDVDVMAIAERYFSAVERRDLAETPTDRRTNAFFRLWVAKEALLKAHGSGLQTALDAFSIRFPRPFEVAQVETCNATLARQWEVRILPSPAGWQAALCSPPDCVVRAGRIGH